ncbi:hypothetical protein AWENTII_006411 [Aspergillus wentii]|nr:hypothetical protein MW887_003200 [Aspergillus wentii]
MPRPSSEIAIPESVWEQHKKIIWNLYIHQNGKKKKVMEIMEAEHGFNATDWQFEEHFKKWGFRKNFRAEEWKAIQHHILKRKNAGRPDSDVYDNGLLVPKKKVQKGTYRNGTISTVERFTKCPSPKLPAGVVVCTPPASVVQWPKTGNLPWVSFHTMLVSRGMHFRYQFPVR